MQESAQGCVWVCENRAAHRDAYRTADGVEVIAAHRRLHTQAGAMYTYMFILWAAGLQGCRGECIQGCKQGCEWASSQVCDAVTTCTGRMLLLLVECCLLGEERKLA